MNAVVIGILGWFIIPPNSFYIGRKFKNLKELKFIVSKQNNFNCSRWSNVSNRKPSIFLVNKTK